MATHNIIRFVWVHSMSDQLCDRYPTKNPRNSLEQEYLWTSVSWTARQHEALAWSSSLLTARGSG